MTGCAVGRILRGVLVAIDRNSRNVATIIVRLHEVALDAALLFEDEACQLAHEIFHALGFARPGLHDRKTDIRQREILHLLAGNDRDEAGKGKAD